MSEESSGVAALTANEIMTAETYAATRDQTVGQVAKDIIDKKISGAPVVDNSNVVISVVSEVDLMKFAAAGGFGKPLSGFMDKLVSTEKVIKVKKKDSFKEIFKHFLLNPVRRVIVVDDSDKLQGIISRRDILKAFLSAEEEKSSNDEKKDDSE